MAQLGAPSIEMSKFFAWLLRRALNAGVDIGSVSVTFFWPVQIFYVSLLFFGFSFFYCFFRSFFVFGTAA